MAYIGKPPVNGFHTKQSITGDGSTTSFALTVSVSDPSSLIVSVGGVLQEPGAAYSLSGGGSNIVFSEAPSSTDTTYVQFLGTAIVQNNFDTNGAELILDVNGNTSLHADTDDEIDIKVGGSDRSTIKATGYHNLDSIKFVAGTGDDMQMYHDGTNSYLTNATGALKIATETSGIALTIGHTTSEVTFGDNVTVTGNLTIGGTTSFGDFDITNVGSLALDTITNDGTDITLDSSGDIILDAGGNTVFLKDSGTTFGSLDNSSGELVIKSGSSPTTALTFAGANATFAGTLGVTGIATFTGVPVLPANTIDSAHYVDGSIDLAHMSVNSIDSDQYVDGSIDTAHIADNQVTLAKMAGLARGKIIYGDSSGDPAALTVGGDGTALMSDGTDVSWGVAGTSWQAVVTGATTMVAGRGYFVNTTSSAFTMTLPASPSLGDTVRIIDYAGTFDSNTCTIGRNSEKIAGASADMTVTTERAALTLVFTDSTQGWLLAEK